MPNSYNLNKSSTLHRTVGRRIRDARTAMGTTQAALGEAVGLSQSMVGRMERGLVKVSLHQLEALCLAVGLTPSEATASKLDSLTVAEQAVIQAWRAGGAAALSEMATDAMKRRIRELEAALNAREDGGLNEGE